MLGSPLLRSQNFGSPSGGFSNYPDQVLTLQRTVGFSAAVPFFSSHFVFCFLFLFFLLPPPSGPPPPLISLWPSSHPAVGVILGPRPNFNKGRPLGGMAASPRYKPASPTLFLFCHFVAPSFCCCSGEPLPSLGHSLWGAGPDDTCKSGLSLFHKLLILFQKLLTLKF